MHMDSKRIIIFMMAMFFVIKILFGTSAQTLPSDGASATTSAPLSNASSSRWTKNKFAVVSKAPLQSSGTVTEGITLSKQADGHYYTDANVNNISLHFLIDTGASGIALTGSDARALGLNWNANDLEPIGRGASGTVMGKMVTLGSVQVGQFQAFNVQASIIPDGLDVSLLGQSFMSHVPNISIADDKMTLR